VPIINITVRGKVATANTNDVYVCGNSDYVIRFDFDAEWNVHGAKTARFVMPDGTYQEQVFTRDECPVPIIENVRQFNVGVFAGNLYTTTPAYVPAKKSILCGGGKRVESEPDVYNQLIEKIDTEIKTAVDAADLAVDKAGVASKAAENARNSERNAADSVAEAQESVERATQSEKNAAESAEFARKTVESKGWLYVEGREDGHLYLVKSDIDDGISMKDDGKGRLVVVYGS
jgi:hypothetical protein